MIRSPFGVDPLPSPDQTRHFALQAANEPASYKITVLISKWGRLIYGAVDSSKGADKIKVGKVSVHVLAKRKTHLNMIDTLLSSFR